MFCGHGKKLPEELPLRQLLVDQLHYRITNLQATIKRGLSTTQNARADDLDEMIRNSAGLTTALLWKSIEHGSQVSSGFPLNPSSFTGCHYHVHEGGKKCK